MAGRQRDTKNARKLKTNIFPGQQWRLNINHPPHPAASNIFTDQSETPDKVGPETTKENPGLSLVSIKVLKIGNF